MTDFASLGLTTPLLRSLSAAGYETPTPVQAGAIPHLLSGGDLLGLAQTGTGKTAAFALPMLQRLNASGQSSGRTTRALVLAPTRELAIQVEQVIRTLGQELRLRSAVIFGGVGQEPQVRALSRGLDILVATPGRLLDLMQQGHLKLDRVEIAVLDEADRMLDMGFIRDVRKIVAQLPRQRQTMLFSATLPDAVGELATGLLINPKRLEVTPPATTVERVDQRVLFVDRSRKRELLAEVLDDDRMDRVIVFTRTKHGANRVAEYLQKVGVTAEAIHGNKSQSARQRALEGFKSGRLRALIATDIAARGIDVQGVSHVINFELPVEPESYVHRIGRTARAGRDGVAMSFCDAEEVGSLRAIERLIRQSVRVEDDHGHHAAEIARLHEQGRGSRPSPRIARGAPARARNHQPRRPRAA